MPVQSCRCPGGRTGYQWGESGTCYCRADPDEARDLAERQGRAIRARGYRGDALTRLDRASRTYHRQRASDRALVRVAVAYSRRLSAIYQDAIAEAVAEVLPRSDARLVRVVRSDLTLTAEQADRLRSAMRAAIRRAREQAERVSPPTEQVRAVMESQATQAVRAGRQYLTAIGASAQRLAATLRVPDDELVGIRVARSLAEQDAVVRRVADCLDLITSEPGRMALGYEREIGRAVVDGSRWETIARSLEARTGMDARHARLIARDQTNKLNSGITEATQRAAGIDRYIWRATPDGLTRDSHAEVDGLVVAWSSPPPGTGPYGEAAHAGMAIQCRCQAEAVIPPGLRLDESDTSPMPEIGTFVS